MKFFRWHGRKVGYTSLLGALGALINRVYGETDKQRKQLNLLQILQSACSEVKTKVGDVDTVLKIDCGNSKPLGVGIKVLSTNYLATLQPGAPGEKDIKEHLASIAVVRKALEDAKSFICSMQKTCSEHADLQEARKKGVAAKLQKCLTAALK
jgi:hypothetical protein